MTWVFHGWLAACVACPLVYWRLSEQPATLRGRLACIVGLVPIAGLTVLGSIWPGLHTLLGLASLPAGLYLIAASFAPRLLSRSTWRVYAMVAQGLALVSGLTQVWWLAR